MMVYGIMAIIDRVERTRDASVSRNGKSTVFSSIQFYSFWYWQRTFQATLIKKYFTADISF